MRRPRVLVFGGTGYFGRLLIEDLETHSHCDLVLASRRPQKSIGRHETIVADISDSASVDRALCGAHIVICAAGPFQLLPTTVAELCLRRGIHYIDLADDRGFVARVRSLVPESRHDLPAVCTAWSTVSALSGLLAQIGVSEFHQVDAIYVHMAPGNRGTRNVATVHSLIYSVGRSFTVFRGGSWHNVCGWSEPRTFDFPSPVGRRVGYLIDVPDHDLFPTLFRADTVEFRASSELSPLNWAVSTLAWTRKVGLIRSWTPFSRPLQRVTSLLRFMGHDWGAVGVEVAGPVTRRVSVVARSSAQRIAVMPAVIMTNLLTSGAAPHGLVSPATWLTKEELRIQCEKRGFQLIVEES